MTAKLLFFDYFCKSIRTCLIRNVKKTMSRKVYYKYDSTTDSYEKVSLSRWDKVWNIVKTVFEFSGVALLICLCLYYWIDLPKEKMLREENERLREEIDRIDNRLDVALKVMDEIAQRDNNFYRVMMQADPITDSKRYSGLERMEAYRTMSDGDLVANVIEKSELLDKLIYTQIKSFDSLRELAATQQDRLLHIPSIQPISAKDMKQMASGYGYRVDPVYGTTKFHEGMDFASAIGTKVYATGAGTVLSAGWQSGYGLLLEIDHGYGYVTRYAHLSEIKVHQGQKVSRGDFVGRVGNTGKSTGSHLHYEVRYKGAPQNPIHYYFQDLTPEQYADMIREAEAAAHVMD